MNCVFCRWSLNGSLKQIFNARCVLPANPVISGYVTKREQKINNESKLGENAAWPQTLLPKRYARKFTCQRWVHMLKADTCVRAALFNIAVFEFFFSFFICSFRHSFFKKSRGAEQRSRKCKSRDRLCARFRSFWWWTEIWFSDTCFWLWTDQTPMDFFLPKLVVIDSINVQALNKIRQSI